MDANILIGSAGSAADGKGRFAIPAQWRQTIRDDSDGNTAIGMSAHERLPCAVAYGTNHLNRLLQEIERDAQEAVARGQVYDREAAYIRHFSLVEHVNFDGAGRFTLPRSIAAHAGIGDKIFFVGAARHVQLWTPERLAETEEMHAPLREAARRFMAGDAA